MIDKIYIDMHLLIDRYLRGALTGDELARFEERLLWDEDLVDDLELAEHLRDGLRAAVTEGKYAPGGETPGFVRRISAVLSVPQYAAAASFLLAVGLTFGLMRGFYQPAFDDPRFEGAPIEIVPLLVVRGTSVQTVEFREGTNTVLLVDAIEDYDRFRVTVRKDEPGSPVVWSQEGLEPTYPESLAISMPANLLMPGLYVLTVEGAVVSGSGQSAYERIQAISFQAAAKQ